MNKKLMALALLACLFEGVALANETYVSNGDCCPVAQPACCNNTGRGWRPFRARPYRSNCCPGRRTCRPKRVRTYRAKRSCCPRIRCCRPKPSCCPAPAPVCEAPACVTGECTTAPAQTVVETPAMEAGDMEVAPQPESVVEEGAVEAEEAV